MLTIDKLYEILENGYKPAMRSQIVYLLLGSPGIGKTQIVRNFAKDKGVNVVTLLCSQQLPNEIVGTHVPDLQGGNGMKYFPPSWYFDLKDGDILFLDEMLTAPKSVLAAMLTMIESRILQNSKVLPDIMIVAAANPTGSAAQIDAAIRDRFQVIQFESNKAVAAKYLVGKYGGELATIRSMIDENNTAEWNQRTPRTVEKVIIQMLNMFNEQEQVSDADLAMFRDMYGYDMAIQLLTWWNKRADGIKNKGYHDAVRNVNSNEIDTVRDTLKQAVFKASVTAARGTDDWIAITNLSDNKLDEVFSDEPKLAVIVKEMKYSDCPTAHTLFNPNLSDEANEKIAAVELGINEDHIMEQLDKLFEEPDISTIIGTLESSPIWENVQELLSQVKLVDVEV